MKFIELRPVGAAMIHTHRRKRWSKQRLFAMLITETCLKKIDYCAKTATPHLAPRLKKEYSYTFTPPLDLRDLFNGERLTPKPKRSAQLQSLSHNRFFPLLFLMPSSLLSLESFAFIPSFLCLKVCRIIDTTLHHFPPEAILPYLYCFRSLASHPIRTPSFLFCHSRPPCRILTWSSTLYTSYNNRPASKHTLWCT
jgi:hypothetical protein